MARLTVYRWCGWASATAARHSPEAGEKEFLLEKANVPEKRHHLGICSPSPVCTTPLLQLLNCQRYPRFPQGFCNSLRITGIHHYFKSSKADWTEPRRAGSFTQQHMTQTGPVGGGVSGTASASLEVDKHLAWSWLAATGQPQEASH